MNIKLNIVILILITIFLGKLIAQSGEWVIGKSLTNIRLSDISSSDSLNKMIVAYGKDNGYVSIFKSEDGGHFWKVVYTDSSTGRHLYSKSISYPKKNFSIAQYDSGYVVRTIDGGKTWAKYKFAKLNSGFSQAGWQGKISMIDEKYGYLCTSNTGPDRIFKTSDGGLKWIEINNRFLGGWNDCLISELICLSKNRLICTLVSWTLNKEGIATSIDGGENWNIITNPLIDVKTTLCNFSFSDSLNGFLSGFNSDSITNLQIPILFKTKDGGLNWEIVNREIRSILKRGGYPFISFKDSLNGLMGGLSEILKTTDGGKIWVSDYYNKNFANESFIVSCFIGELGFAITSSGTPFFYQPRITEVKAEKKKGELILYPNPTSTTVKVKLQPGEEELTIRDVLGKEIKSYKGIGTITRTEEYEIDVTEIKGGIYFITIKSKGGIRVEKIEVVH